MTTVKVTELAALMLDLTLPANERAVQQAFRKAAMWAHPDHGGTSASFRAVSASRDVLLGNVKTDDTKSSTNGNSYSNNRTTEEFYGWKLSAKGNLTRRLCVKCGDPSCADAEWLTVFRRGDSWRWVYAQQYSGPFVTREEAMANAEYEFGL